MIEVACPTGLKGIVRAMKVKDEVALNDPVYRRTGKGPQKLIESCWEETKDLGIYTELPGVNGHPLWSKVLLGDRFYILLQIRVASYGDEYDFNVQCVERTCQQTIPWCINISDLELKPLPPESVVAFKNGQDFVLELPDLPRIEHRLLVGDDEVWISKATDKDPARRGLWELVRRIVTIEGVAKAVDPSGVKQILAWFEDLDVGTRNDVRDALESVDCGVQTTFDVQCGKCGRTQETLLPLEASFFSKAKPRTATTALRSG